MKITIAEDGTLWIWRATGYKQLVCPYTHTPSLEASLTKWACGDWCPLFREPVKVQVDVSLRKDKTPKMLEEVHLQVCNATLSCPPADFVDDRVKQLVGLPSVH